MLMTKFWKRYCGPRVVPGGPGVRHDFAAAAGAKRVVTHGLGFALLGCKPNAVYAVYVPGALGWRERCGCFVLTWVEPDSDAVESFPEPIRIPQGMHLTYDLSTLVTPSYTPPAQQHDPRGFYFQSFFAMKPCRAARTWMP